MVMKCYRKPMIFVSIVSIWNILVIILFNQIMFGFIITKTPTHPKSYRVLDWNPTSS